MQVTSLLTRNAEPVGTKTYWWKRRKPDYIDVSEIKPNPFIQWVKRVRWLKPLAIIIQRIARCLDRTDPGPAMLFFCGLVFGVMFSIFPYSMREPMPTFWQGAWHCTWFGLLVAGLLEAFLYACWECVQIGKWLHKWANRTHPNPYAD